MDSILLFLAAVGIGTIIFSIVKESSVAVSNSSKPVVAIRAQVVAKRILVSNEDPFLTRDPSATTSYFVTFESVEDRSRKEFAVSDWKYSRMAEGDQGTLRHQGTSFKEFERALSTER